MGMYGIAQAFVEQVMAVSSADDLKIALSAICAEMDFRYFALSHHGDLAAAGARAIRLHNYPERWARFYDAHALGVCDPVHRASHVTSAGFCWSQMPEMIPLTPRDRQILALGAERGIGDGYTVPAHVPGETRGSCSFANDAGHPTPEAMLPLAQLVGTFAFEAARRLWRVRPSGGAPPALTDRQRDCVLWAARGKSDWEISVILGVGHETVIRHLKQARERYGVHKRTLLVIRTLFDGTLSFGDIFQRR